MNTDKNTEKELKVMHACELGAVGVYRGHKCVARYVFRQALAELDKMRSHEKNHVGIFRNLLDDRKLKPCVAYPLFFWGGLFYGVFVGLLGLRAIGESTKTVESIVVKELGDSLVELAHDKEIVRVIQEVKIDEMNHQSVGAEYSGESSRFLGFVSRIAKNGAYTAKYFASIL
jgi:ubiquinone biosynthesis monooxygenase Coq7